MRKLTIKIIRKLKKGVLALIKYTLSAITFLLGLVVEDIIVPLACNVVEPLWKLLTNLWKLLTNLWKLLTKPLSKATEGRNNTTKTSKHAALNYSKPEKGCEEESPDQQPQKNTCAEANLISDLFDRVLWELILHLAECAGRAIRPLVDNVLEPFAQNTLVPLWKCVLRPLWKDDFKPHVYDPLKVNVFSPLEGQYNRLMKNMLSPAWLHTYYGSVEEFYKIVSEKRGKEGKHLDHKGLVYARKHGFDRVLKGGQWVEDSEESQWVKDFAKSQILRRAGFASAISFICGILPVLVAFVVDDEIWLLDNSLFWTFWLLDTVLFLRQELLLLQEWMILYGINVKREYDQLAPYLDALVKGVSTARKVIEGVTNLVLKTLGFLAERGLRFVVRAFRRSIRTVVASGIKWTGVAAATSEAIDGTIDLGIGLLTSVVAGVISFLLFYFPMKIQFSRWLKRARAYRSKVQKRLDRMLRARQAKGEA